MVIDVFVYVDYKINIVNISKYWNPTEKEFLESKLDQKTP